MKTLQNETVKEQKLRKPKIIKIGDVFSTNDYGLFKDITGNRHLNVPHLQRLSDSMEEKYLTIPIVVNENYEVIDGQHRIECAKTLRLPIYFIICDGYTLKDVQISNANNIGWKNIDFAVSWAEREYYDYKEYLKFNRRYRFSHIVNLFLLRGVTAGRKSLNHDFKNGRFKIGDINISHKLAKMIYDFKVIFPTGFKKRTFIMAALTVFRNPGYIHKEMMRKGELQPRKFVNCATTEDNIKMLEEIYNYNRSKDSLLRFY